MSAAPRCPDDLPPGLGYAGLRMSADQYLSLGETQERYELIDGVIFLSPSPTPVHQRVKMLLASQIMSAAIPEGTPQVFVDTDVRFAANLVYCPDVIAYRFDRLRTIPSRLQVVPDLVVEVLSPSNRGLDLVTKRHDFERFGVAEYWVIDPADGVLRVWRRHGQNLVQADESEASADTIASSALPGLTIDLRHIRELTTG